MQHQVVHHHAAQPPAGETILHLGGPLSCGVCLCGFSVTSLMRTSSHADALTTRNINTRSGDFLGEARETVEFEGTRPNGFLTMNAHTKWNKKASQERPHSVRVEEQLDRHRRVNTKMAVPQGPENAT